MKRTVALFGATLKQVAAGQRSAEQEGTESAAQRSRAYALGLGVVAVMASTAASQAQSQVLIQGVQEQQQQQSHDRASTIGGVLGLAAGIAATKNQNTIIKLVGAAAGYMGGSAIAEAVTSKSPEQLAQPGVGRADQMRADPLGAAYQQPDARYQTSMRGGRYGNEPVQISRAVYDRYIQQASSPVPVTGTNLRPLSAVTHQGLYRLMVDTVASRAVAREALDRVERMELENKVAPRNSVASLDYQRAQRDYNVAMREYSTNFASTWDVIRTAEQNGYEISAQRAMMSVMPGDMREPVAANLRWPGVEQKVAALQSRMMADDGVAEGASLSTLNGHSDVAMGDAARTRYRVVYR